LNDVEIKYFNSETSLSHISNDCQQACPLTNTSSMAFPRLHIEKFDENGKFQSFYVNRFSEHLTKYHVDIDHPHKHDFYITILFTHGRGRHDIDFNSYTIEPGSIFFLQPEQVHYWEFDEEPEGWIFFHSADFYKLYSPQMELKHWPFFNGTDANPMLKTTNFAELTPHFKAMFHEYRSPQTYTFLKIAALVQLIYSDLARLFVVQNSPAEAENSLYQHHFTRFEELLETHFVTQKQASFYASELGMTTKHLHRICDETTGKSTSQLIADRIILEAKRKLADPSLSLSQVAEQLGYDNYPYFHLFFKKHCGETPKNFRRKF